GERTEGLRGRVDPGPQPRRGAGTARRARRVARQPLRYRAGPAARARVRRSVRCGGHRLLRVQGADGAPRRGEAVGEELAVTPEGPHAYERGVPRALVRRVLMVAPAVLLLAGVVRGVEGLVGAALGLVLVALNFLAAARLITWAASRS